jgi:hypothetical protein
LGSAKEESSLFFSSFVPASMLQYQWQIGKSNETQKILFASKEERECRGRVISRRIFRKKKERKQVGPAGLAVGKCFCGPMN